MWPFFRPAFLFFFSGHQLIFIYVLRVFFFFKYFFFLLRFSPYQTNSWKNDKCRCLCTRPGSP